MPNESGDGQSPKKMYGEEKYGYYGAHVASSINLGTALAQNTLIVLRTVYLPHIYGLTDN
jgi:hypothetical protein